MRSRKGADEQLLGSSTTNSKLGWSRTRLPGKLDVRQAVADLEELSVVGRDWHQQSTALNRTRLAHERGVLKEATS